MTDTFVVNTIALSILLMVCAAAGVVPAGASAEQASDPRSPGAARLDAGGHHTCVVLAAGNVGCWGYGGSGQLGYANTRTIGDDETPGSARPVDLGAGRTAKAIASGEFHTCALIDDGTVRCWGYGGNGRLGYGNTNDVGDNETPRAAGPVNLGLGRTAKAITAGDGYTCAILDDGTVRCWGYGVNGRLGYGNTHNVGDDETPAAAGPVDLGPGRTAIAISAGSGHTCAVLDDGNVRCWGYNREGQLGYPDLGIGEDIGDDETPGSAGPVALGPARTATAISAGGRHTCAVLDDGSVRCWGYGGAGQLGYGNTSNVGQKPTTTVEQVGAVNLGARRTAQAITAGLNHTCALLDDGSVRCWGYGLDGRLGYANTKSVGDDETPGTVGPVDLGLGRTAAAISAGHRHTCALLDDSDVRCWGYGGNGRLGYCNENTIGDDETPGSVGPVNLSTAVFCPAAAPQQPAPPAPPAAPPAPAPSPPAAPAAGGLSTAKLSLARARIVRRERVLDVLAPITSLASGRAGVELHAAGLTDSFSAAVYSRDGRIRFRKPIPKAQARLGTGIITITYPGDADTRPQTVRLRAASQPAHLQMMRPTMKNGWLRASGTVSKRARGVVRVQIEYVVADKAHTRQFTAPIDDGKWSLNRRLSQTTRTAIAQRTGTVHSYTLFTGYYPRRIRGEMRSYQVLGPR